MMIPRSALLVLLAATIAAGADNAPVPPKYQHGTITGWTNRIDPNVSGGARRTRVYELRGADLVYQIDYCGSFQSGQFTAGQTVDYRVDTDSKRIYVLRDNGKEYKCRMEGVKTAEGAKTDAASAAH